jgi:hypothetical protein
MEIVKRSDEMDGIVGLPVAGTFSWLGEIAAPPRISRTLPVPSIETFVTLSTGLLRRMAPVAHWIVGLMRMKGEYVP